MKSLSRYFLFVVTGLLALTHFGGVRALAGQTAEQAIDAPKPKGTVAPDAMLSEARRLSQEGKFDEAIGKLEALALKEPELQGLARELGVTYYKKSDYLKAVASFKKALEEDPRDNEAVQLMGLSYYLAGRPAEAIGPLEKVQTWYASANVDAAYILGICYVQTKDYAKSRNPEAVEQFQKELELNPGEAAVYYKLADAYSRLQKYEEAERLLQRSIWLDATSTGPYILMGKVLEKKGETALAVRALQHAIAMDPNNPMPHHLLGQTYREMGRTEEAERELKLSEQLQIHEDAKP